jgi:hypothetical protein
MKHWPFTVLDLGGRPKLQVRYRTVFRTLTQLFLASFLRGEYVIVQYGKEVSGLGSVKFPSYIIW